MARSATAKTASTSTRGRRAAQTPAQAGQQQHANGVKTDGTAPTSAPAPQDDLTQRANAIAAQGNPNKPDNGNGTNDANLVVPRIEHSLLVQGIKEAAGSFKAAISVEVAVCIAVFAQGSVGTSTAAKKELYGIYKEAGYECEVGGEGKDYKTVNRRINYAAQFFDSLKEEDLKAVLGDEKGLKAMQALVGWLTTKYNFRSMNDVQMAAGVVPASRQPRQPRGGDGGNGGGGQQTTITPPPQQSVFGATGAANPVTAPAPQGTQQPDAGDKGVMAAMGQAGEQREQGQRRAEDDNSKYVRHTYEGATIVLPLDMAPAALGELGIKLMHAANQMRGATLDVATLNAEFKELVAAH